MSLTKVSGIWRMSFLVVLGALIGSFMTIAIITKRIETGDTINIGKIKIKNASQVEVPVSMEKINGGSSDELTRKEKRQQRKDK